MSTESIRKESMLMESKTSNNIRGGGTSSHAPSFYPHVAGLRAIAITLVVLFHLFPEKIPSGYVGVDVFLVISGYFMLGSMWNNRSKPFIFSEYMRSRIMRIYPATLFMLIVVILLTFFALITPFANRVSSSAIATVLGISNWYFDFAQPVGYFAIRNFPNPLAHMWYLGVVLQAYFIFGGIYFLIKQSKIFGSLLKWLGGTFVGIAFLLGNLHVILLICQQFFDARLFSPDSGYYWTSLRLWEFMAGGLLVLTPDCRSKWMKETASVLSIVVITAWAFIPYDYKLLTLPIVVASALFIKYGANTCVGSLLSRRLPQHIGKISFSLYLWHWPIIVLFPLIVCCEVPWGNSVCIAFIFVVFSELSYFLIEKRRWSLRTLSILVLLVMLFSLCLRFSRGGELLGLSYKKEIKDELYSNYEPASYPDYPSDLTLWETGLTRLANYSELITSKPFALKIGARNMAPHFVLIGDCHAGGIYPGMDAVGQEIGVSGIYLPSYITPFCNRTHDFDGRTQSCNKNKLEALLTWLHNHPELKTVFIVNRWSGWIGTGLFSMDWQGNNLSGKKDFNDDLHELRRFIKLLYGMGKKVILMPEVPTIGTECTHLYASQCLMLGRTPRLSILSCTKKEYMSRIERILHAFESWEREGICRVLHIEDVLFPGGRFWAYQNEILIYSDAHHLTNQGSNHIANILRQKFLLIKP